VRTLVLAAFAIVVCASDAAAKRVVVSPTIQRVCPKGDTWQAVVKCVTRFGKVKIVKTLPEAKLIFVGAYPEEDVGTALEFQRSRHVRAHHVPGYYLYVADGARWKLGGSFDGAAEHVVFGLANAKVGTRRGYRFDTGVRHPSGISFDGDTTVPAMLQQKFAVFCSGASPDCARIITSCDLFVGGKAYHTFRGKLAFEGDDIVVGGDRKNAGIYCAQEPRVSVAYWSQD
jgi:hypothetical protein